jgi:hypothetical protein
MPFENIEFMKTQFFLLCILLMMACGSEPKVVSAENAEGDTHAHATTGGAASADAHTVVCKDFMHAEKYTYMSVEENGSEFWIAVPRQEVVKGATYHYTGGLKKSNFKSTEFDRVFETIVLVSGITPHVSGSGSGSAVDRALAQTNQPPQATPASAIPAETVKISELFKNRANYEGKTVTVSGTCVKINKMIMGRNWVHIDDGSMDGDLTVTTLDEVPVGATVAMTGTITLNKDFGAGYRYEVIMENAQVVK